MYKKIKKVIFIPLFASLIAVCGFISVPLPFSPIPIVLQNMMVVLTGILLGPVLGGFSTLLFLLVGLLGLPIFSGGGGGLVRFLGPTGGFLYGYLLSSVVSGVIVGKPNEKKDSIFRIVLAVLLGFLMMYITGSLHFMFTLKKTIKETLLLSVLPYIPFDLIKAVIIVLIAPKLRKVVYNVLYSSNDTDNKEDEQNDSN